MSSSATEAETPSSMPDTSKVLTASYLEKHKGTKDLVSRLRTVATILKTDKNVEPDSEDYPGLAAMSACLVEKWLGHKDKDVRLYTTLCCMELFEVYAPEAPWDEAEICSIFQQTIRQLANFAHTTSKKQTHFDTYYRILDILASVKVGIVLVDLAKNAGDVSTMMDIDDDEEGGHHQSSTAAFGRDEGPLELLAELFKTALQSLRPQHPPSVAEGVKEMITCCLEEYHGNVMVPYELVDQILICVGQGPTIMVTNPALAQQQKGKKKEKLPRQVAQPNMSFSVAVAIIRKNLNGLSTPVSMLLNGLINGDPHILQRSSIVAQSENENDDDDDDNSQQKDESAVDVWSIIHQLGLRVPNILTTVVGTVSNCLRSEDEKRRYTAASLLGKLFTQNHKLANKFYSNFREWILRFIDTDRKVRLLMAHSLCAVVRGSPDKEIVSESEAKIIHMMLNDPDLEIRTTIIHAVCDQEFESHQKVSVDLLKAVGTRLISKHTSEYMSVLTGLAQIYFRLYMREGALKEIIQAGDDCDVGLIVKALAQNGALAGVDAESGGAEPGSPEMERNEKYRWIASKIFQCCRSCFCSTSNFDVYSRLLVVIDDLLLGSDMSKNKQLSPTARAVGFSIIVQSLQDPDGENVNYLVADITSNAFGLLSHFFRWRLGIQKALGNYLEARRKNRDLVRGSEEALAADNLALAKLQRVVDMIPGSKSEFKPGDLVKLHACRDKHVFRLLGTIIGPQQSKTARFRALDDIPKRTESLGESVAELAKAIAKAATMGSSINTANIQKCLEWAKECLEDGEIASCVSLLSSVKVVVQSFPSICDGSFDVVRDMFSSCCAGSKGTPKRVKSQIAEGGVLSFVTSLLAVAAAAEQKKSDDGLLGTDRLDNRLRKQLLQLCTKDGTPQQARSAVAVLKTTFCRQNSSSPGGEDGEEEIDDEAFTWLIKALTAPSQMSIDSNQIVSILAGLTELAKQSPGPFSHKAAPVIRFALEGVLLGRLSGSKDDDDESSASDTDDDGDKKTPAKGVPRRSKSKKGGKHLTPVKTSCLLEDSMLSFASKRLCAAMEFLVCHVSSTILKSREVEDVVVPTDETLRLIFQTLTQIIHDHGVPPSNRDRDLCKTRADMAALRQCAGVCLLRLCSSSLRLESTYLNCEMWHTLSEIFLDEEISVRTAVISELNDMIVGQRFYKHKTASLPPSLRFMALIVFCADGDHTSGNSRANANAANVGKLSQMAQFSAKRGVVQIRNAWNAMLAETMGNDEELVEEQMRKFCPEYSLFYAFHLLAFRRETPTVGLSKEKSEDAQYKMLKKRLKWLFEPLVKSLGEAADNISFLLSMKNVLLGCVPLPPRDYTVNLTAENEANMKLNVVCKAADEVLLSFVKKDYNLDNSPHDPWIPEFLFQPRTGSKRHGTPQPTDRKSIGIAPGVSPILAVGSDDEEGSVQPSEAASAVAGTATKLRRSSRHQPKTASPVPVQITVGTSTPANRKKRPSVSQSSDEEEDAESPKVVKPLGDSSNRARPKRSRRAVS